MIQDSRRCAVCDNPMRFAFSNRVLGCHPARYFHCAACGFLQAADPYWLQEAYSTAISDYDTGLLARNIRNREILEPIFHVMFSPETTYLDLAGGYGVFARLMRDAGFDYWSHDVYCQNLFCGAWEANKEYRAAVLSAFEVLEHVQDPFAFVRDALQRHQAHTLVFSTEVYSGDVPPCDWWYYMFESGQHISFFRPDTLRVLAARLGMQFLSVGAHRFLVTRQDIPKSAYALIRGTWRGRRRARAIRQRRKPLSLTWADHLALKRGDAYGEDTLPPDRSGAMGGGVK